MPLDAKGKLLCKFGKIIAHADDIDIMAKSFTLKENIRINENKTKIISQTRRITSTRQNIMIDEYNLETVGNFMYFGVQPMKSRNEMNEIKCRIELSYKVFFSILPTLKVSYIHREAKLRAYKWIDRPGLS